MKVPEIIALWKKKKKKENSLQDGLQSNDKTEKRDNKKKRKKKTQIHLNITLLIYSNYNLKYLLDLVEDSKNSLALS